MKTWKSSEVINVGHTIWTSVGVPIYEAYAIGLGHITCLTNFVCSRSLLALVENMVKKNRNRFSIVVLLTTMLCSC